VPSSDPVPRRPNDLLAQLAALHIATADSSLDCPGFGCWFNALVVGAL
jgi:hypothetical protein